MNTQDNSAHGFTEGSDIKSEEMEVEKPKYDHEDLDLVRRVAIGFGANPNTFNEWFNTHYPLND